MRDVLDTRFGLYWGLGVLVWLVTLVWRPAVFALALLPALGGHAERAVAGRRAAAGQRAARARRWPPGSVASSCWCSRCGTATSRAAGRGPPAAAGRRRRPLLAAGGDRDRHGARDRDRAEHRRGAHVPEPRRDRVRPGGAGEDRVARRHHRPRRPQPPAPSPAARGSGAALRRTLQIEVVLGLAAIAPPARSPATRRRSPRAAARTRRDATIGPARMEMTVDPARVGPNEMHVYLFDRASGRQYDAREGADRHRRAARRSGSRRSSSRPRRPAPVTTSISGATFGVERRLDIEVAARVSDFDEYRAEGRGPDRLGRDDHDVTRRVLGERGGESRAAADDQRRRAGALGEREHRSGGRRGSGGPRPWRG